jgi:NADH-quinone oxidoreductase subunit B
MLMHAILELHEKIKAGKLGSQGAKHAARVEAEALDAVPTHQMKGLLR